MPKAAFYAVQKGISPGIYLTWAECEQQIKGYSGAVYKKFGTLADAESFCHPSSSSTRSNPIAQPTESQKATAPKAALANVTDETQWTVVYTDGACPGNGQPGSKAGVGVWWGDMDPRNISERCPGDQTNNRAELIAIIRCLEKDLEPDQPLIIKTDSSYSISCIRDWLSNWVARGWKGASGAPVKNKAVIQHLAHLLDNRPGKVRLQYVRGHAGIKGNEGADRLAVAGSQLSPQMERTWLTGEESVAKVDNPVLPQKLEIDADFPMLSLEELEKMGAEQNFD